MRLGTSTFGEMLRDFQTWTLLSVGGLSSSNHYFSIPTHPFRFGVSSRNFSCCQGPVVFDFSTNHMHMTCRAERIAFCLTKSAPKSHTIHTHHETMRNTTSRGEMRTQNMFFNVFETSKERSFLISWIED